MGGESWGPVDVPFEEEADAVFAEGAAVLQKQGLVHALFGVGGVAVHLRVEAFDEEAVGFSFGDYGVVLGDVLEAGFVVAHFDLGEFSAELSRFDVLVILSVRFLVFNVRVCT